MSKVVFELSDGVDGEIQLRDNAFMDFWKMVFTRNNKLLGPRQDVIIGNSMSRPIDDPIPAKRFIRQKNIRSSMKSAKEFHANCVAEVNKSIDDLEKAGWPWRHGKLNSESAWDDCNRIHRGFTTYFWSGVTDHLDIPFDKLIYLKTQHINFRAYESKFLIPWLMLVFGLNPVKASNKDTSAQVSVTSPICIGIIFLFAFISSSDSIASIKSKSFIFFEFPMLTTL